MQLMLKPLRMLLMPLLHKLRLRALLQVVLVTAHLLVVAAVIAHLLEVVIVLLPVVVLLLHPLMVVVTLLGPELRIIRQQRVIGMVMTCMLIQNSDIFLKNIQVILMFIGIRTPCITE